MAIALIPVAVEFAIQANGRQLDHDTGMQLQEILRPYEFRSGQPSSRLPREPMWSTVHLSVDGGDGLAARRRHRPGDTP